MTTDPNPTWKWAVCGVLLLATLLNYMDRQALAQTATELKARYDLDDARYGRVERGFSWAFAAGAVTFGWLADRIGPRRLYPVVVVGWSLAGFATPFAGNPTVFSSLADPPSDPGSGSYHWLLMCRTALGFFEAGHWPCALIAARRVLTAAERPFGNGLLQSGASLGAVLTPLYVLVVRGLGGGWEVVFWTIGGFGLLWVPLWVLLIPRGHLDGPTPVQSGPAGPTGWVFFRRLVALIVVVNTMTLTWQFVRAWLPKFLKEFHGYSDTSADLTVAGYYLSADLGCLGSGYAAWWLSRRGWSVPSARVVVFATCVGLTAAATVVPFLGGSPSVLVPVLMLVGAGVMGLHPHYYALAQELPARRMGLMSGGLAASTWFTVGAVQATIGDHVKATGNYDAAWVIAGLSPVLGLVAMVLLWRQPESDITSHPR
jgi:ACS family hexuronate transporter-like MFS transporter